MNRLDILNAMAELETTLNQPSEVRNFPWGEAEEQRRLLEILNGLNTELTPIPGAGYIVHNREQELMAEAPWVLLDFDDTAARTTQDKENCHEELQAI